MNNQTNLEDQKTYENQNSNANRKFIVLDIVFYGSSLNYDQGAGNYQELKKITKWDGNQYTLVSRYALRYSILETGKNLGLWELADASHLQRAGEGEKTVIQPAIDKLLSGEILNYPEFDLFGYLVTNTVPQNAREAPVKISHAVSLTPYRYDSHFSGNLGLARRMIEKTGKMDPNLFIVEEHQTYYIYNVVIDVDKIGKNEVYLSKKIDKNLEVKVEEDSEKYKIIIKKKKDKNNEENKEESYEVKKNSDKIKIEKKDLKEIYCFIQTLVSNDENDKNKIIKERIKQLIKSILYLNRDIKGRREILSPKLLIAGFYKNVPYKSYKDRIILSDEYEEIFGEKRESEDNEVKIIRKMVKLKKPYFILKGMETQEIKSIDDVAKEDISSSSKEKEDNCLLKEIDNIFSSNEEHLEKLLIFKSPEIEVRFESTKHSANNQEKN